MTTYRLTCLREKLGDLDAIVITNPQNRRFLTGFTGSAGTCFISQEHAILATDFRYYTQVQQECTDIELSEVGYDLVGNMADLFKKMGATRVGFESDNLTVSQFNAWKEATPGIEWIPTQNMVEDTRAIKSVAEIETLRHATKVTDYAFARALQSLKPGITEKQLQWALKQALFDIDGREESFEIIVAAGKGSAKPHARASNDPIPPGVPIVIDMGALVDGYHADMTRTIVLGEPDAKFRKIYDIVLRALKTAPSSPASTFPNGVAFVSKTLFSSPKPASKSSPNHPKISNHRSYPSKKAGWPTTHILAFPVAGTNRTLPNQPLNFHWHPQLHAVPCILTKILPLI